jgi:hypothetical protein
MDIPGRKAVDASKNPKRTRPTHASRKVKPAVDNLPSNVLPN